MITVFYLSSCFHPLRQNSWRAVLCCKKMTKLNPEKDDLTSPEHDVAVLTYSQIGCIVVPKRLANLGFLFIFFCVSSDLVFVVLTKLCGFFLVALLALACASLCTVSCGGLHLTQFAVSFSSACQAIFFSVFSSLSGSSKTVFGVL